MKVLFIAPLYGRKRPQLSYSKVAKEMQTLEDSRKKSEFSNFMTAIEKARHENTQKHPSKQSSKVCCV